MTDSLEPEVAEARPLAGGGFELRGHFERGLLRRNTGSWRLRISDTGVIDPRSLLVDVGAGGAGAIAELAARRHLALAGQRDTVERAEVRRIGTESRPRYVAVVQRGRGERPLRVIVTGFGLVEWEHLLVTPARAPVRRDGGQP